VNGEREKIIHAWALVDTAMLLLQRYGCMEGIGFESMLSLFMENALTVEGVHNVIKLLEDKALTCAELPYNAVTAALNLLREAEKELFSP
jgi:hypothetical protein